MIAGLIVLQAVLALKNQFESCKRIELGKQPVFESKIEKNPVFPWSRKDPYIRYQKKIILDKTCGELIVPIKQNEANNGCQICGDKIKFNSVKIDLKEVFLYLFDLFLRKIWQKVSGSTIFRLPECRSEIAKNS